MIKRPFQEVQDGNGAASEYSPALAAWLYIVQSKRRHFELQEENVELANTFPLLTQSNSPNPIFTCKLRNSPLDRFRTNKV